VVFTAEPQVDALVRDAVAKHPVADASLGEQPHAVGLEDARAHGVLDLGPGAVVDDDRLDARDR
jgi:hypothetical protein